MRSAAGDVRCSWVPDALVDLPRGEKMLAADDKMAAADVGRETGSASRQPERPTLPKC